MLFELQLHSIKLRLHKSAQTSWGIPMQIFVCVFACCHKQSLTKLPYDFSA